MEEVVKPAKSLFDDWMLRHARISPNIRDVVYAAGVKFGGQTEWRYCWETYRNTSIPSEREIMLKALGFTSDPWLLQRYLLQSLDRNLVRSQDVESVISAVAKNPEGKLLAWRHLKAHWPQIQALFGNSSLTMGTLINHVTTNFFTEYDYLEVSSMFMNAMKGSLIIFTKNSPSSIKILQNKC